MCNTKSLVVEIANCRKCVDDPVGKPLPHAPRPVAVISETAKIRIIGQAPGTRVHASGKPFTDPSGDRLREWMGVDEETFYDEAKIAITPMGFCFPGLDTKGGDLPPRKECATLWQEKVSAYMPQVELTLLVGMYAQRHYLGKLARGSLTATVADWRNIISAIQKPVYFPLPHPSWRNNAWIKRNPWFSKDLLPEMQSMIQETLNQSQ